jgi:AcrR family transcriptional regulator
MAKASARSSDPPPYHHGNLAPALIAAALALLDETQDWSFSLREVARRAGVSHNAPYKHFPEKRDLLAAVSARGFEMLAANVRASLEHVAGARERLLVCGATFVAQAVAKPALYRLMFSASLTSSEAGRPAIVKEAASRARGIIDAALADGVRAGEFPSKIDKPATAGAASLAIWSILHGLAMLAIDDFVGPPEEVANLAKPFLGALLHGVASNLPTLPEGVWIAPRL